MAATSADDENEIHLFIKTEAGECIKVGDVISIPMKDCSFEQRKIKLCFMIGKSGRKVKKHYRK